MILCLSIVVLIFKSNYKGNKMSKSCKDKRLTKEEIDKKFHKLLIEQTIKQLGRPLTDKEIMFLI